MLDVQEAIRTAQEPTRLLTEALGQSATQLLQSEAMALSVLKQSRELERFREQAESFAVRAAADMARVDREMWDAARSQITGVSSTIRTSMESLSKSFMGPLERLQVSMGLTESLARAMEDSRYGVHDAFKHFGEAQRTVALTAARELSVAHNAQQALFAGVSQDFVRQFAEVTRPLDTLEARMHEQLKALSLDVSLTDRMRLPIIDYSAAAAIAKAWGTEGIARQLRSIGLDTETFERLYSQLEASELEEQDGEEDASGNRIQNVDVWTAFSIVLTIIIFFYQKWDTDQMEGRLTGEIQTLTSEIRTLNETQKKDFDALGSLLREALASALSNPAETTQFVVRHRIARIVEDPSPGSIVIAEVFPNQVVTLVDERRKWIKIEYYDWIAQETREGWALKKYFLRIRKP